MDLGLKDRVALVAASPAAAATIRGTKRADRIQTVNGVRDRVRVVVGNDDRVGGGARRDTGGGGDAEGREAGAGAREQRVRVTVVAAGELEDPVALREPAREPERAHRRLGAGGDQAHHFHRRIGRGDSCRQLTLGRGRRSVARSTLSGRGDGVHHGATQRAGPRPRFSRG